MEMLIAVPAVRNLIREQKTFQLPSVIQTSRSLGMLSLDDEILKLLRKGVINAEDAYHHAIEKSKFTEFIGGDVEPEFGERRMSA